MQDIANQVETLLERSHESKSVKCKSSNFQLANRNMLLVTLEKCEEIMFSESITLFNTSYETMSFSSKISQEILETSFNLEGQFYTSQNGSIPVLSNLSHLSESICACHMILWTKIIRKALSNKDHYSF